MLLDFHILTETYKAKRQIDEKCPYTTYQNAIDTIK